MYGKQNSKNWKQERDKTGEKISFEAIPEKRRALKLRWSRAADISRGGYSQPQNARSPTAEPSNSIPRTAATMTPTRVSDNCNRDRHAECSRRNRIAPGHGGIGKRALHGQLEIAAIESLREATVWRAGTVLRRQWVSTDWSRRSWDTGSPTRVALLQSRRDNFLIEIYAKQRHYFWDDIYCRC